jgi:diacylglycerol kinase (ATP)
MSRKIIYLINPISGTLKKQKVKDLITRKTLKAGIDFEILPSNEDGNYESLHSRIKKEDITDVVICGGDGTLNAVVKALHSMPVNIGIIPIGSGNSMALAAKIPKQTNRALDVVFKGQPKPIDAFFINEKFSCALCGIGFDAEVAHEFAKQKTRGFQTYLRISTMKFFSSKPYPFEIEMQDRIFRTDAYFIIVANSNQFGNNFTIAPKANMSDGLLDIVIVKKMNKMVLPFSVLLQVAGNNSLMQGMEYLDEKNIIYTQTDKISIRNPAYAPIHIDGEPTDTSVEFNIRVIPGCFKLIHPQSDV